MAINVYDDQEVILSIQSTHGNKISVMSCIACKKRMLTRLKNIKNHPNKCPLMRELRAQYDHVAQHAKIQ